MSENWSILYYLCVDSMGLWIVCYRGLWIVILNIAAFSEEAVDVSRRFFEEVTTWNQVVMKVESQVEWCDTVWNRLCVLCCMAAGIIRSRFLKNNFFELIFLKNEQVSVFFFFFNSFFYRIRIFLFKTRLIENQSRYDKWSLSIYSWWAHACTFKKKSRYCDGRSRILPC